MKKKKRHAWKNMKRQRAESLTFVVKGPALPDEDIPFIEATRPG